MPSDTILGGTSNDSFTSTVYGGNASLGSNQFDGYLFGGNSNFPSQYRNRFVESLIIKLNDDQCWSTFNDKFKYYLYLVKLTQNSDILLKSELPPKPMPIDNPLLNC